MKMRFFQTTSILLLCGALTTFAEQKPGGKAGGTNASAGANTGANTGNKLEKVDEEFVMKAAQGGMVEVQLGDLAKSKGKRDDVKKFGEMMVNDHGKANGELKMVASSKGLTLPEKLDAKHSATVDRLSKLEGDNFDKAYLAEMVKDHEKDVKEFEAASKSAKDVDVKAFVDKTLPVLRKHLEHVRGLAK